MSKKLLNKLRLTKERRTLGPLNLLILLNLSTTANFTLPNLFLRNNNKKKLSKEMLITSSKTKVMFKNLLTKKTGMKISSLTLFLRREEARRRERETGETSFRSWILII